MLCALLLGLAAALAPVGPFAPATPAGASPAWDSDLLSQVNTYRAANGVGPLRMCPNLTSAAQSDAADMAARRFFSHVTPEGRTLTDRVLAAGYDHYTKIGENIASGFGDVSSVMAAWIASPGHRENLLDGAYGDVGFGLAFASDGTSYWVQDFGANGSCGSTVTGNLEAVSSPWPQTLRATGWAYDTLNPTTSLPVDLYADGAAIGHYTASQTRLDVAGLHPEAGVAHGFDVTFNVSAGSHTVCAYATSTTGKPALLGCKLVSVASADPIGSLDTADATTPGVIRTTGWTFDPEATIALDLHVYVDGGLASITKASKVRNDIGILYPAYGAGHGFDTSVTTNTGGFHQVCTYGINVFLGSNRLLGCRTVLVPDPSPIGNLDGVDLTGPRQVRVRGWTFDPETSAPINTDVYVDGLPAGRFLAAATRNDVGTIYPAMGAAHGFAIPLTLAPGTHTVCSYGINVGTTGVNTTLGCRTVVVPGDPVGSFDTLSATAGTLTGTGWAIDPDTTAPIVVHVYVDGAFRTMLSAGAIRNDIAGAFPYFGAAHGYSFTVAAGAGSHSVCTYGINTGAGANRLLGCRTITS